ncbi:Nucleotidyl transferase family [Brevundimonas sp. BAL3]|uniref:glycosyltransferase family 2 protein n=1 Tax=Brevundimonas sp. BAL3 TaxID=391600 RepID=UPI00017ECA6D|nr:glycosyltransferase family 2 protein [Brevundimonas sp. BAL3]EDX79078.1 Nucleotidyl transferase family [Brevundimonas sp. BAL3]
MGDLNRPLQVLVPIAGRSAFFSPDQYFFPKPLIEIGGRPMIERVVENLSTLAEDVRFIFIVQREDVVRFSLDRTLKLLCGGRCEIIELCAPTQGALCSTLMAIDVLDRDTPLIIANGDQIINIDLKRPLRRFRDACADAGVITFESVHPRWSYVRLDADNLVLQAAEKRVISRTAIAGFYYFASAELFVEAAKNTIRYGESVEDEYFIAPSLNELVLDSRRVVAVPTPKEAYHSFYSPDKIREFEDHALKRSLVDSPSSSNQPINIVIPAAGEGSRFRTAGYAKPKPFIDVEGTPMIEHVLRNVTPAGAKTHILLRREHMASEQEIVADFERRGISVHAVEELTEGTACTLLLARSAFDTNEPLLVANSDQYVDFSVADFVDDCVRRNLDGSILVFKDPTKDPKWSFARLNEQELVTEVAEKKAISDLATVGIYFFRRGDQFVSAAIDMIARNERVHGEFYTCPVYNYMIANGQKIGVYEIPQSAMSGLGTPDDLDAYLRRNG